jgi:phenylpyruvate tautomerase PptA (4-oxalocrotonate tautomerase family)
LNSYPLWEVFAMPFVEVFASGVPEDRKKVICEELVAAVMEAEGAPDSAAARAISWLVWQEVSAWSIGGQPVSSTEAPRYLVRISVPAGSLTELRNAEIIRRATAVLAAADDQPDRLYQDPVAWVQVIDIAEGAWGALGRPVRFPEIANYLATGAAADR